MTTRIAVFGTGDSSGEEDVPQPIKDAARGDCQPVYEDVPGVVEKVLEVYVAERHEDERFLDTYRRIGLKPFKERVYAQQ